MCFLHGEIFQWRATSMYDKTCIRQKDKKWEGKWKYKKKYYEVKQNVNKKQKVSIDLQMR